MALDLNNRSVLITGGTGSFGKHFTRSLIERYPDIKRLVIFSRDELKQYEMSQIFTLEKYPFIRFFIGDVRDEDRLVSALQGIDIVIHAAALKQVPAAEYNPIECIKTNVLGAENVINACLKSSVEEVVALSTDKAAAPINLYGATKLCSDKLFVAANNIKGSKEIKFSVVRYGNVMGSRGSVIPFFMEKRSDGILPITHKEMTRFNISLDEAIELVFHALEHAWGGEIFVPKIPSYKITTLAEAIAPKCELTDIGIRPGEKLHEEMITETDSINTVEFENHYVILPSIPIWDIDEFITKNNGKRMELGFKYNSGSNSEWLEIDQIRDLIKEHIDPTFQAS